MDIWFGYWIVYDGEAVGEDLEGNAFTKDPAITDPEKAMEVMRACIAAEHHVRPEQILFKSFNRV